jgi:PII-like signaling protein
MELAGPAKRLTVYVGERDRHDHHSLAIEIVQRAHAAGLAGVTVFRGVESYGKSNHIHTTRILSLSDDLPVAIVIVDHATAITAFAEQIIELVEGGLVTIEDVEVLRYVKHDQPSEARPGPGEAGPPDR